MDRRELLKLITILTGASVVGGDLLLSGCKSESGSEAGFSARDISLMDEIGETILPATDTPGAKAARIGDFMKIVVNDCYAKSDQKTFSEGLVLLEKVCKKEYNKSFVDCSKEQRHDLLVKLEKEAKLQNEKRDLDDKARKIVFEKENNSYAFKDRKEFDPSPSHYYTMLKQLTLWGFFSSEIGMTKVLKHLPVPGKYDGAVAYNKGDRAWSE